MTNAPVVELLVRRIGYLVPRLSFVGTVQSVYARACNIASDGMLLTLVAPDISDGPTVLVLGGDRVADLRKCFRVRDRVVRRNGRLTSPGADVDLARAASWHPDSEPVIADPAQVTANHRVASARLAARLDRNASVIHREGRVVCARVEQACRDGHFETAVTDGFRFAVAVTRRGSGEVETWLPAGAPYAWPTWEVPAWHERLKPAYAAMRDAWGAK